MSLVLHAVLNAPYPDDPSKLGVVEWMQIKDAMCSASDVIHELTTELANVKSLEWWTPSADNNYTHGAKTIFGTYYVGQCGGRYSAHAELSHDNDIEQFFGPDRGSLFAAQRDATDHYVSRVRGELE